MFYAIYAVAPKYVFHLRRWLASELIIIIRRTYVGVESIRYITL